MKPTETLQEEHRLIQAVLTAAEREVQSIGKTGRIDGQRIVRMVDFFRNFADRCHHAKEEDHLFRKMEERGMPSQSGPIAVMRFEHEENRKNVRAMADALPKAAAGEAAATASIAANLISYVERLKVHIEKENHVLYPMADNLFSEQDQQELEKAFAEVEAREMGEGAHEKYHRLAIELSGRK
jgi:hemerythrin-like domain-containing protein